MTVLWVTVSIKTIGDLSDENSIKTTLKRVCGKYDIVQTYKGESRYRVGYGYEVKGLVFPSDFPENEKVQFVRDGEGITSNYIANETRELKRYGSAVIGELPTSDNLRR